jgi:hypothetical protein
VAVHHKPSTKARTRPWRSILPIPLPAHTQGRSRVLRDGPRLLGQRRW